MGVLMFIEYVEKVDDPEVPVWTCAKCGKEARFLIEKGLIPRRSASKHGNRS